MRKLVFICHPFRGNGQEGEYERNTELFKRICKYYVEQGKFLPLATALYLSQFLDDCIKNERELGIAIGHELLGICDEVHVFDIPNKGISEGMKKDLELATKLSVPVIYRKTYPWSDNQ